MITCNQKLLILIQSNLQTASFFNKKNPKACEFYKIYMQIRFWPFYADILTKQIIVCLLSFLEIKAVNIYSIVQKLVLELFMGQTVQTRPTLKSKGLRVCWCSSPVYCQAQTQLKLNLGCAGSKPSFSIHQAGRQAGIVLSSKNSTGLWKQKLFLI